ncbi:MAG: hypothetical protein EOM19_00715 [Candidatus Moranbacteria bacterium]|nr:hypothetical protein [Candidatus Moranbacteria bacterium]
MSEEKYSIVTFVLERIRLGAKKDEIKEQVLAVGWSEDEFDFAYTQALKDFGIPIPEESLRASFSKKATTLEVVLNLFSFILLGTIAIALGTLYFEIIDKYFPDLVIDNKSSSFYQSQSKVSTSAVHYSIASLIIAFPLFFLVMRIWFRKFRKDEGKTESHLTKWVTYLVLLVASIIIVGDLITIVFTFLQGEMSVRFFLKALVLLVIAGIVFGFYFFERKMVQYKYDIPEKTFFIFSSSVLALILVAIIMGFFATGSPQTERMRRLDSQRSGDLSSLSSCIEDYANRYKKFPENILALQEASSFRHCSSSIKDPETGEFYEYSIKEEPKNVEGEGVYELCASFSLVSDDALVGSDYRYNTSDLWYKHGSGRTCFSQRVFFQKETSSLIEKDTSFDVSTSNAPFPLAE